MRKGRVHPEVSCDGGERRHGAGELPGQWGAAGQLLSALPSSHSLSRGPCSESGKASYPAGRLRWPVGTLKAFGNGKWEKWQNREACGGKTGNSAGKGRRKEGESLYRGLKCD